MKKFLFLIPILMPMIVLLSGCTGTMVKNDQSNDAGFVKVYSSLDCRSSIYIYEETDVMYVVDDCYQHGGISVMIDENGKPMLWSNWKSYYESLGDK